MSATGQPLGIYMASGKTRMSFAYMDAMWDFKPGKPLPQSRKKRLKLHRRSRRRLEKLWNDPAVNGGFR